MTTPQGMLDDDIGTLQAAVEHLRSVRPDEEDMDGRARRADAAFRIAYKLEQITKRRHQGRETLQWYQIKHAYPVNAHND